MRYLYMRDSGDGGSGDALVAVSADEAVSDADGKGLKELLKRLGPGDVMTVASLSELGASIGDVVANAALIMGAGCALVSIEDRIDTSADEAFASHISALSKASSDIRSRKVRAGMAKAAGEGKKAGRPKVDSGALQEAVEMYESGGFSVQEILDATGVSRATLYRRVGKKGGKKPDS